MKSIKYTKLK